MQFSRSPFAIQVNMQDPQTNNNNNNNSGHLIDALHKKYHSA